MQLPAKQLAGVSRPSGSNPDLSASLRQSAFAFSCAELNSRKGESFKKRLVVILRSRTRKQFGEAGAVLLLSNQRN